MVDALASGASPRKGVEVQVLSWAPLRLKKNFGSILPLSALNRQTPKSVFLDRLNIVKVFMTP